MTPADSFWHADVSTLPVHAQSATWISSIGSTAGLKADFGAGQWNGGPIGIPYTTVPGTQPRVPVSFTYDDESDAGPYPIPPNAPIEGGPSSTGDRHVLVVDRDACRLWELYSAYPQAGGTSWTAGSGATWDLNSNAMRPLGWTSGDAAGLPILPGLVRYDEVAAGAIDHVIRFTAPRTASAYVWPASHKAATGGSSIRRWDLVPAQGELRHQPLLGAEPGDPARPEEARAGSRRQRLAVFHERRAGRGLERLRSQRPENRSGIGVRGGRRLELEDVEHVVCRGGRNAASASSAATATSAELVTNPGFETSLGGWGGGNSRTSFRTRRRAQRRLLGRARSHEVGRGRDARRLTRDRRRDGRGR